MNALLQGRMEELALEIAGEAKTIEDINKLLRGLMKPALERILDAEMDVHLGRKGSLRNASGTASEVDADGANQTASATTSPKEGAKSIAKSIAKATGNHRNGHSKKTVKGEHGELTIETPRDRNATFEPQLIPKYQRRVAGFDEKILALYAKGMTTRDIQDILHDLYEVEVSATLISEVTSAIDDEVKQWRTRPLDSVWPIVYFDGLVMHIRGENKRVSQHTIYVAIGVNISGHKELLGLWWSENEGAKFWLHVLTDMKNRGLNDIFVACIDGLSGFKASGS